VKTLITLIALCLALASSAPYAAETDAGEEDAAKSNAAESKPDKPAAMPLFKPTNVGAPLTRLGGATRSATGTVP
jgi:hypothetical protein